MSQPPLSQAQRAAVEHAFADALVMAGAGSGKTRVLSERFVQLVRTGVVPLRRLAALTFTEKAAAQMRERIAALFRRRAEAASGADAMQLEAWRGDVEFAPISTIHAFCALLLRQHAVEAGVDPAFEVLDAVEAGLLLDDAAELAENRLVSDDPEGMEVFHALAGDTRVQIVSLLERLRGAGVAPDDLTWHGGRVDLGAALEAADEALADWALAGDHLADERRAGHVDACGLAEQVLRGVRADEEVDPFLAAQAEAAVAAMTGPRQRAYTAPRKALEVALGGVRAALLDAWVPRRHLAALRRVLATYDETYRALKHKRAALDFTDLELGARDLLRRAASGGHPLDLAPSGLLVDEFQDTNPMQAEILGLLRAQAPQFSVGDPKQSIYRFRRADVGVILEEQARVGAAAVHPMNASYRACAQLVAGVNAIHARLFADGAGGVDYDPLESKATYLEPDGPVLDLCVIDTGRGGSAEEGRRLEAAWIAERIRTLVESETPRLRPAQDDATQSIGPLRYGDVAILFRAAGSLDVYEHALEAAGVPFLTQKSKGFYQAEEIVDLLYVLRVVHNPEDRHALACTVSGPAMAATDADLLRWFGDGDGTPWERLCAEADQGSVHADVVATLRSVRTEAAGGSLAAAVERVLLELGLYETALLMPGGDRRAANLRKAVELARRLDHGGRRGLADLLRHLAELRDRESPEAEAPIGGEADDVVRLTTVHGAKGLEYPVVFVADVGRSVGGGPPPNVLFDGKHGVAAKVIDPLEGRSLSPAGYEAISETEKAAEAEEALRVLYVAMTRAEERLILSGWCKGITGKADRRKPSYLSGWGKDLWAALALPCDHGRHDLSVDGADIRLDLLEAEDVHVPVTAMQVPDDLVVRTADREEAADLLRQAAAPVAPLGNTRYVVSVSELLTFAESPQRYYRERVIFGGARAAVSAAWDRPLEGLEGDAATADGDVRHSERLEVWDEHDERHDGIDRAALGRAVHAVIEHLGTGDDGIPAWVLERAVQSEAGDADFAAACERMALRFLASPTGARMRAALTAGEDVRREVALHARIRFPGGETVAGLDSLLVKGSIDLWLPSADGTWIVDHKTNRAGGRFRRPEDLAEHYAWQLRLYALAVERVLGRDVAGARLLLLDPGWGPEAVEVDVDVSGEQLEDTRRLCRAFAIAELEGRYPEHWTMLLS